MIHNLSKIFMDYGDSNWTIGVLIGLFIVIAGVILWAIGEFRTFPNTGSLSLFGMIIIIVGFFFVLFSGMGCVIDEEQQIRTAISNEYENVSFNKPNNNMFTSNAVTYIYKIKDRKIIVRPLDDANAKIIK